MSDVDPKSVSCPTCGAKEGRRCKRPSGHSGPFVAFHAARRKAAEEVARQTVVVKPCERCGGVGMIFRMGLWADPADGFAEGADECPDCAGERICPKCGGEMYYPPIDDDPDDLDEERDICERCGFIWDVEARHTTSAEVEDRIMRPAHWRWREFIERLEGPEGCDFRKDAAGKIAWRCAGGHDQSLSRAILETMEGIDVEGTLAYFSAHGGHCDCEVVFNVEVDTEEGGND